MPDQDPNNQGKNLNKRIEELVSEMDEATEKLSKQIDDAALSDEEFDLQAEIGSAVTPEDVAAASAEKLAGEANPAPEAESEPTEPESSKEDETAPENETTEAPAETLDAQIEDMLEDAGSSGDDAEPAESQPRSAVDAVDAELAGLAEEMLDGDFDDAEDVIEQGIEPAPKQPAASNEDAESKAEDAAEEPASTEVENPKAEAADDHDDLLDGDFDDAEDVIEKGIEAEIKKPAAEAETEASEPEAAEGRADESQPEPASEPVAGSVSKPAPEPVSAAPSDDSDTPEQESKAKPAKAKKTKKQKLPKQKRVVEPKADTKLPAFAAVAAAHTNSIAFALAEKINKPLDSKPTYMRDIAGWLAAVTLFNAFAVWVFLLIGRGPTAGTSSEPAVELVGQSSVVESVE